MVMLHFAIANEQRELRELKHGFEPKTSGFSSSQKSKRCDFDLIVRTNVTDCTSESAVKTMPQYKWTLNSLSPPSSPAIRSSQTEALLEKRIVRPDLFPRREKIEDQLSLGSTVKVLSHHINSNILKNHIPKEHGVNERQSIEIPRERSTANYPSLFEKEHAYNYHLYAKESRHHELPSPIERKKERIQEPWLINSEYTTSFAPTSNYKSYFSDENLKHNDISKLERDELKRREAEKQLEHMEMRQEGFKFREYVSEPKPTPLEIEKAVNYLKTLEDKRIEKKQKSVWAKTRALVGLKKKDYDNKYYKNILESIRRGVIPGEVSTLIAINQFNERQQLNEECVKPSKKVRKADKSEKQISQNSSDTQKVYLKVHAKVDIELRSGGGTVTKGDMARRHEFGPPVEDDPVVPLGQLFLLDEWDTKLPARVKMTREGLFRVLYKIVGDFNTERNNADSVVLMHPQFVEDFFKLEKQLENEPKSKESEPETLDELEEEEEGKIYRGLLEPEIKMTHEELVKCYACFSGGLRQMNRAVIPVFRAAHFVLVHVGRDANEDVHAHIMDSKLSESKNPYISDEEARHIAGFLFNAAAEDVKISRAGKTLIPYQKNNVDCGLHTIWSAEACLRDDRFNPDIQRLAVTRNPDKETMQQVRARISRMLKDMLDEERRDDRGQDEDLPENKETLSHSITSEKTSRVRLTEKRKIEEESEAAIGEPVKKASSKFFKGWRKEKEHDVKPNKTRSKTGKFAAQEENKSNDHEIVDQKSNLHVLLNPVNSLLASAKRRKDLKVLQRIKSILEKATNESQAPGSSTTTDSSESGESYSPEAVTHNNRWLTTEQKKELVEKFDKKKSTLKQLIRIYCLSKNEQYARTQISRYRTELQTGKPNTRQAHSQLAKRTASMLEHADKVEMAEIHEKDIERLGLQQSVCFGLKNFKASNFWVHTTKGRSNFVSRHIDLRLAKTPKPGALTVEQKVDMFRRQECERIKKQYPPERIFNVDQTAVRYESTSNRTLTEKGNRRVARQYQRVNSTTHSFTVNPCISAAGELIGNTFITLSEPVLPQSFQQMVAPFTDLTVTSSKSGVMSSYLAKEWLTKVFIPNVPDNSVLMLDAWPGFKQMKALPIVAKKKLEIVEFPSKTTSELQPLDLSFNRQFKHFINTLENQIRNKEPNLTIAQRETKLNIIRFTLNQFKAPRFRGLIQRGFSKIDVRSDHIPYEKTPAEFCFEPKATAQFTCSCRSLCFVRCGHCDEKLCAACSLHHLH